MHFSAQAQMGRFRIVEEENQKLKMEIAEQIQFNSELKATLTLSQDNYETLLKNFESLKEEVCVYFNANGIKKRAKFLKIYLKIFYRQRLCQKNLSIHFRKRKD